MHLGGPQPPFHEKTPKESTKSVICEGGGKKSEILGGPAEGVSGGRRLGVWERGVVRIKNFKRGFFQKTKTKNIFFFSFSFLSFFFEDHILFFTNYFLVLLLQIS